MKVCIIDQELRGEKRFQIMVNRGNAFYHVFPGKLFTKENAVEICKANNYTVISTGTIWQCMN